MRGVLSGHAGNVFLILAEFYQKKRYISQYNCDKIGAKDGTRFAKSKLSLYFQMPAAWEMRGMYYGTSGRRDFDGLHGIGGGGKVRRNGRKRI